MRDNKMDVIKLLGKIQILCLQNAINCEEILNIMEIILEIKKKVLPDNKGFLNSGRLLQCYRT